MAKMALAPSGMDRDGPIGGIEDDVLYSIPVQSHLYALYRSRPPFYLQDQQRKACGCSALVYRDG